MRSWLSGVKPLNAVNESALGHAYVTFDRLLVAQARVEKLVLVTKD